MLKDDISNDFNFQQRRCLHIEVTTDTKQWNTIVTATWRTVYEHIVPDALRYKKRS